MSLYSETTDTDLRKDGGNCETPGECGDLVGVSLDNVEKCSRMKGAIHSS